MTTDGKLVVTGDLSVTRVERSVTIEPNEAYSGPVYGKPVAHTDAREITLVFSDPQPAVSRGATELSGSTPLSRETFPQLLSALMPEAWPTMLVNHEKCSTPSTIGEDYSGQICTGTVIATVTNNEVMIGTAGGEDYRGFEPAVVPNGNQATIALNLELTQLPPAPLRLPKRRNLPDTEHERTNGETSKNTTGFLRREFWRKLHPQGNRV